MGCRKRRSATNKIYAANHDRVTQEQHVHQADLDQGQDNLTVRDQVLIPCYTYAKYFLALRKACPLETLKAPAFLCESCILRPFPFGNKHLHISEQQCYQVPCLFTGVRESRKRCDQDL